MGDKQYQWISHARVKLYSQHAKQLPLLSQKVCVSENSSRYIGDIYARSKIV